MGSFEKALESLINEHSMENGSNTPDAILASYMQRSLDNFNQTLTEREAWYGRGPKAIGGEGAAPVDPETLTT